MVSPMTLTRGHAQGLFILARRSGCVTAFWSPRDGDDRKSDWFGVETARFCDKKAVARPPELGSVNAPLGTPLPDCLVAPPED